MSGWRHLLTRQRWARFESLVYTDSTATTVKVGKLPYCGFTHYGVSR